MRDQAPLRKSGVSHYGGDFLISFSPQSTAYTTYTTFLGSLVVSFRGLDYYLLYICPRLSCNLYICLITSFSDILVYIRNSMP